MKELTFKKEINPVLAQVSEMQVNASADMALATELLSRCNKVLDKLTTEKELLTKPLNATLKEIRSRYKPMEDELESAIATIKSKMASYQQQALLAQVQAEAKIADRVSRGTLTISKGILKMGDIDAPEKKVVADSGSVGFRDKKCFEVVDLALLPMKYHLPNEVEIRKQMVAGIELAGCRYWVEQSIINKRN